MGMNMTSEEMQDYFPKVYPKMFVGKYGGVACGSGWFYILDKLCANIQHHIDWTNKSEVVVPQVTIDQIKEKFGCLRFYYSGGDEYISGMVTLAESMSGVTCEECGSIGERRSGGWIRTLCDTHEAERQTKMKERFGDE
jgi:hypothetical protein